MWCMAQLQPDPDVLNTSFPFPLPSSFSTGLLTQILGALPFKRELGLICVLPPHFSGSQTLQSMNVSEDPIRFLPIEESNFRIVAEAIHTVHNMTGLSEQDRWPVAILYALFAYDLSGSLPSSHLICQLATAHHAIEHKEVISSHTSHFETFSYLWKSCCLDLDSSSRDAYPRGDFVSLPVAQATAWNR